MTDQKAQIAREQMFSRTIIRIARRALDTKLTPGQKERMLDELDAFVEKHRELYPVDFSCCGGNDESPQEYCHDCDLYGEYIVVELAGFGTKQRY